MKVQKNIKNYSLILIIPFLLFCGINKLNASTADSTKKIIKIKTIKIINNDTTINEKTINISDDKFMFYNDSTGKFNINIFMPEDLFSDFNKNFKNFADFFKYNLPKNFDIDSTIGIDSTIYIDSTINIDSIIKKIKTIDYDSLFQSHKIKMKNFNDSIWEKLSNIQFNIDSNFYKFEFNFDDVDSTLKNAEKKLNLIKMKTFPHKKIIKIQDLESPNSKDSFLKNIKVNADDGVVILKIDFNKIDKKTYIKLYDKDKKIIHEEIIKKTTGNTSRRFDLKTDIFYLTIKQGKTIFRKKITIE